MQERKGEVVMVVVMGWGGDRGGGLQFVCVKTSRQVNNPLITTKAQAHFLRTDADHRLKQGPGAPCCPGFRAGPGT